MDLFNMPEREKMLLVSAIMISGKKGLDEFLLEMNRKALSGSKDYRLSKHEAVVFLNRAGINDFMIEKIINNLDESARLTKQIEDLELKLIGELKKSEK